jgi:hypothetical protein
MVQEKALNILKGEDSLDDIPITRLSEGEENCVEACAHSYLKMLSHMLDNFERRATFEY